ncbi:hypothetical protein EYC84_001015 [Monilinia fructicola]|uniref:Uncharacterized protein n=1 Tax=Monilinia fructicola TaxID=38448 RepID=A0A5M9JR03_MONFR|nr:hypothetical protein EYC84_001015 [Monilinia fructicola]
MEHAMDGSLVAVIMNCVGKLASSKVPSLHFLSPSNTIPYRSSIDFKSSELMRSIHSPGSLQLFKESSY